MQSKRIMLVLMLLFMGCSENGTAPEDIPDYAVDDSAVPLEMQDIFRQAANGLVLRNAYADSTHLIDSLLIPEAAAQPYYFAMVQVYLSDLAARDSVFNQYFEVLHPDYALHEISIAIDPDANFVDDWFAGVFSPTGDAMTDSLLTLCGLELAALADWVEWTGYYQGTLSSTAMLNTPRVADELVRTGSFVLAEPVTAIGDGARFLATMQGDDIQLSYDLGWNACPTGCTFRHQWTFRVSSAGEVTFMGSSGAPLPQ